MTNPFACGWGRVRQCFRSTRKKNYGETDADNIEMGGVNSSQTNFVEVDLLRADINATRKFPDNAIRTSKYTWLTSFPLSLANQFRNVSNPYFLIVVCLTLIPGMSPINPFSSIFPLTFVIIAGMAKDIWEDKKRQESDKRANAVEARVLRGNEFVTISAREVQVGDILLHRLGDEVLADAIVLNTSHADGVLYIETANLDGETNAKTRRAKPQTIEYLGTVEDIIDQCLPNANLREHYVKHGTTLQWHVNAAHAPMSTANRNRDRTDAPRTTATATATATATNTATVLTKGTKVSTAVTTQPVPSLPEALDRTRTPGRASTFRMASSVGDFPERLGPMPQHGATHARSHTFGGDDPCELRRAGRHHCRQPTFDERFAVGGNLPVPSDIVHMSREYEHRHYLDRASMGCASEHPGASIRLEGCPVSDGPTTNIPLGESTGEGSGVVLLAATPRADLYSWIGQLRMMDGETVPLDIEQFIPRGCVVRNTEWVLCAVVCTGRDTKMLLNYLPKSRKVSVIGKRINILNAILFIMHQIFVLLLCGLGVYWRNAQLIPPEGTRSGYSIWYIQWQLSHLGPAAFFASRYITYFVLLSYFIPISLYVTLEFNKVMQMILLARDRRMADFDEFSGELRYSRPKTSELNCQLAHVQYIFTDKTGTLTENLMTYVGGCTSLLTHDEREHPGGLGETFLRIVRRDQRVKPKEGSFKTQPSNGVGVGVGIGEAKVGVRNVNFDFNEEVMEEEPTFQYLRALALCHTVVCFDRAPDNAIVTPETVTAGKTPTTQDPATGGNGTDGAMGSRPQGMGSRESHERLLSAALGASLSMNGSSSSGVGRHLHGRTGSSCWYAARHNEVYAGTRSSAMPFEVSKLCDRSKVYEGQSLDEIALVTAARDNLFTLYRRTVKHMFVKVIDKIMCYEIIAELGFSPQRKLMSILLCRSPEYDHLGTAADPQQQSRQKEGEEEGAGRPKMGYHLQATLPPHEAELRPRTPIREPSPGQTLTPLKLTRPQRTKFDCVNEEFGTTVGNSTEMFSSIGEHIESDERPYLLLVKGADNSMLNIVNKQNPQNALLRPVFQRDVEEMARQGLRTLMLGQRYCTEREVRDWLPHFNEALCSMDNRNEKLHKVYALMERDVDLIGTTAVEDRLQEGVPETLNFFLRAEVVVWMLTGDKRETAVAIAGTSGIIDEQFEGCAYHLDVTEVAAQFASPATGDADNANAAFTATEVICVLEGQLDGATAFCDESELKYEGARTVVLVVDGRTLDFIFASEVLTQRFFELGCRCRSAVCCRMTPLHKADIVRLFHKYTNGVTLAVGDGANDVSMIQESHIGVGIMGLEGSQAELASDYSIPKFRFLKRLLVVHGRFSLYREGNCIVFSIYKNIALTSGLTAYSFFSGYSGVTLIESWLIALFNIFFCAFQPLVIGTLDKDVEDELAESLPAIYPALAREEMFFSWQCIFKCLFDGVVEGLLFFFLIIYTVAQRDELYPWHSSALEDYGMLLFFMILLLMNIRAASFITCYTAVTGSVILFGFVAIPVMTLMYSALPSILGSNWSVYIAMELMGTLKLWIFILFTVGVYVVYGLAVNTYMMLFWPWTNGGPAMTAAWRSPYRLEHHGRRQRLKQGQELLWESKSGVKRRSVPHLRSQQRTAGRSGMSGGREE